MLRQTPDAANAAERVGVVTTIPPGQSAVQTRTGLCRHSNQSLRAAENSTGKRFGEGRDGAGIFAGASRFPAAETALTRVPGGKPRRAKGYSDGPRKRELRRTVWWSWQDSKLQPSDYGRMI
jgi:hypothetical protein